VNNAHLRFGWLTFVKAQRKPRPASSCIWIVSSVILLQKKSHVCVGRVSVSNTGFGSYLSGNWLTPGIKCLVFSSFAMRPKFRAARSSSCTRRRRLHSFLQEKSF
jgi:hypothetical protein